MNGAESLARTLVAEGLTTCFCNPGTSEMHFVAALDHVQGMRCVPCLFEGVATGAADGWARMTGRPGLTLLHLGPGLANGLANLHNARKALSPLVNIVGEHTTSHFSYDAPLSADIEGIARPMSHWVRTGCDSTKIADDAADAIAAARSSPGRIATLILPADTAWGKGGPVAAAPRAEPPAAVGASDLDAAADALRQGRGTMMLLGNGAVRHDNLVLAAAIGAKTGARMMAATSCPRIERGAGHVDLARLPYDVDQAIAALADVRTLVLIGAADPVSFFGYPGKPGRMASPQTRVLPLASPTHDIAGALGELVGRLGAAPEQVVLTAREEPPLPAGGALTAAAAMAVVARLLPEKAIVVDESVSNTGHTLNGLRRAASHDLLQLTGGSIGMGPPLALGAALASPGRKVVNLQADGSAMYTLQALWTQARERADVVTVIWSNGTYAILEGELAKVGAGAPGSTALDLLSLRRPALDWVKLSEGLGVPARRAETVEAFSDALHAAMGQGGPFVIEAVV